MKAEHVKAQADEAFRSGNFGDAVAKYSECIDLLPGGDADARLLCNRSLANHRAGRHKAAISDAARACELAPQSSKAWYRLGAARQGGGDPSAAADAFVMALRAQPGDAELRASMRREMLRLTREGLAARLVRALDEAQGAGLLDAPSHQDVSSAEKEEALFRHIQLWHRDKPGPGDYYDYVALWSEAEWSVGMAYVHRAEMFVHAKCYSQAGADAAMAVQFFESQAENSTGMHRKGLDPDALHATHIFQPGTTSPFRRARIVPLAWAWFARGEAFAATDGHASQDWGAAASCYVRALDLDPAHPLYSQRLADAAAELSHAQLSGVLDAVYVSRGGARGRAFAELGVAEVHEERVHRSLVTLLLAKTSTSFGASTRRALLAAAAEAAAVPLTKVLIDKICLASPPLPSHASLRLIVNFGVEEEKCTSFTSRCAACPSWLLGGMGSPLIEALGAPLEGSLALCEAVEVQALEASLSAGEQLLRSAHRTASAKTLVARRPDTSIELPYANYQLVRADGQRVERVNKHPFQLSRVYYSAVERPDEVWAGLSDGSCRWRQSASEVAIIALRVPPLARKADLDVSIDMRRVRVASRRDGSVYLEGELERGVIPEESVWALGGGDGEDGFVLHLKKMNLELIASTGSHADTWWTRLFTHHSEIAWDDYEKDYSDLPAVIMREHLALEHKNSCVSALERAQKGRHEQAAERNDARRRSRQERLAVLRGGPWRTWVELDRLNPPVDGMPALPPSSSAALLDLVRDGASERQASLLQSITATQ